MPSYIVNIKSNDGATTLNTFTHSGTDEVNITVTSTGATIVFSNGSTDYYAYSGTKTFVGLAYAANATEADMIIGQTYRQTSRSNFYIVESSVMDYRPLSYVDAKIQVDSAIRDANGVRIDTNYQRKPQVIEYTVPSTVTTGTKTLAEYNGTYDGSPGYVRFIMEVTSSSYKGIYTIEASWGQANGNVTLVSGSGESSDVNVIFVYCPSSSSYYASSPPFLAVQNNSTRDKQVKITILEDSGDLTWKDNWNTTAPTTHYNSIGFAQLNYTAYVKYARSAESASTSTYSNQSYATKAGKFRTGESDAYKIMAVDHTGVAYKINTSGKKFPLPISMYVGQNASANQTTYDTYVQSGGRSASYTYVTYLSSSSYNNFTLPTLTASDGGKTLYVRGSLDSDGYFVCDGNVTLSMEAGYTYIPFGTLDPYYSGSTAQVPTSYSFNAISVQAYTLDANGKLTHIDGQPVGGGGGSLEAVYPVGSIYMNASNSTNPATLLGFGTWTALAPGRVLMGAGTGTDSNSTSQTFTAGDTTGEYSHTLTTSELASHGHSVSVNATNTDHTHGGTTDVTNTDHVHGVPGWTNYATWSSYDINGSAGGGGSYVSSSTSRNVQGAKYDGTDWSRTYTYSQWIDISNTCWAAQRNDWSTRESGWGAPNAYQHSHTFGTGGMSANASHGHTVNQSNAGGDGAHNNVQPSLVVYMWVRTA